MAFSPTQLANGNFPVDQYHDGDIRDGAATPDAGPAVPDTTYTSTGEDAIGVAMAHREQAGGAVNVANMSNAGTHSAG